MGHDLDRIDRLEIRVTEQDAVIDDLNATITAQWRVIDALKRQVERLVELVETAPAQPSGGLERPPHY